MTSWVRWRLLAHGSWTKHETDLILDLTSYETVTYLAFLWCRPKRHFLWGFLCIVWVIIMLGVETLIALIGFTYTTTGDGALFTTRGQVRVARLDYYFPGPKNETIPGVNDFANEQYLAHVFGQQSETLYRTALNAPDISLVSNNSEPSYGTVDMYKNGSTDWVYKFNDWTFLNETAESVPLGVLSVSSKRYVDINTVCATSPLKDWDIIDFNQDRAKDVWNMGDIFNAKQTDYSNFGPGAITFFNPDYNAVVPESIGGTEDLSTKFCGGTRCATIGIFAMTGDLQDGNGVFYECNITVSEVKNISKKSNQTMTDHVARLAAGSIGLDGIIYRPGDKDFLNMVGGSLSQYYRYNNDTLWGHEVAYNSNHSTERVARLVGGFAAGSIANLDRNNPTTHISGQKVEIGVRVQPDWFWMKMIVSICLGIHSILVALVLWLTHPIILPEDSHIAVADIIQVLKTHSGMTDDKVDEKRFQYPLRRRSIWQEEVKRALEKERALDEEDTV